MGSRDSSWATPITLGAAERAAKEWPYFCKCIHHQDEASLADNIVEFARHFGSGVRLVKGMENMDDQTIMRFVVMGIEQSGSHSFEEIEEALGIVWIEGSPVFPEFPLDNSDEAQA